MTKREGIFNTHQKALNINLDSRFYGTFAEIGAGQEVVRWFFRVGGAAGTIAKSISDYDMTVSAFAYITLLLLPQLLPVTMPIGLFCGMLYAYWRLSTDSELVVRYTHEVVTQVLDEYPDLTGLGITLGERMGGMTPDERRNWLGETFFNGITAAKRIIEGGLAKHVAMLTSPKRYKSSQSVMY
mgnify:CR=1 FL=1